MRYRIFRDHGGKFHLVRLSDEAVLERYKVAATLIGCGVVWTVGVMIAAEII